MLFHKKPLALPVLTIQNYLFQYNKTKKRNPKIPSDKNLPFFLYFFYT